jgi:hypothetical protein
MFMEDKREAVRNQVEMKPLTYSNSIELEKLFKVLSNPKV